MAAPVRIHLFHRRSENHIRAFRLRERAIRLKRAWIARVILVRAKLRGVNEDADGNVATRRARRANKRAWPACSAPIVGTRPTILPGCSAGCPRPAGANSATVRRISIRSDPSPQVRPDSHRVFRINSPRSRPSNRQIRRLPRCAARQVIALRVRRKRAMLHIFAIVLNRGAEERRRIRIAANKFCRRRKGEIHQIVEDKNLPVAFRAGANADRRDGQRGRDLPRPLRAERLRARSPPRPHRPAQAHRPSAGAQPRQCGACTR